MYRKIYFNNNYSKLISVILLKHINQANLHTTNKTKRQIFLEKIRTAEDVSQGMISYAYSSKIKNVMIDVDFFPA